MKRTIARGRMLPQSLSTDPRYGHLSLKAQVLYPLLWVNCDDQGRLSGNPDEIKYAACPSVKAIDADEVPGLLEEMEAHELVKVYSTSKTKAIQMLDWWEEQKLQWAYPSRYPAPEGWQDHLRYHPTPKEIITENWPPSGQQASELLPSSLPSSLPSKLEESPLTTPFEKEKEKERGKGRLPSALGSNSPSSSPASSPEIFDEILKRLTHCYKVRWGRVLADDLENVVPRGLDAKTLAQLRDLAKELSAAGCQLDYIDQAFNEAAVQSKLNISYVRAILLDWLGVERNRPP